MRKSKCADIGRSGTPDQFLEAFNEAAGSRFFSAGYNKSKALLDGAAEAFNEGHPENIQAILPHLKSVKFGKGITSSTGYYLVADSFHELLERSMDQRAAMNLALVNVPEQDKKELLSHILLSAAQRRMPPSFLKQLHENGAEFEMALSEARAGGYHVSVVDRLVDFQEMIADKPAVVEVGVDVLLQMQEQMRELTEEVRELKSLVKAPAQPKEKTPPQKRTYPSLKGLKSS